MSHSKLVTPAQAISRKRSAEWLASRRRNSGVRFSFPQDCASLRRITRERLVTVRQLGDMKTDSIRSHSMKAVAGVVLAAAISTPNALQAADQTAWDKTFPKSEKVEHRKVSFKNRYG